MRGADVIVVGLGSMGAATAYELTRRGATVIGLDRFSPPHERGAHGGGSRIIRAAYMEGAEYVPMVRRAYDAWRALEDASGAQLLTVTGGLMIGAPGTVAVAGALDSARAHELAYELLDASAISERFPAFIPRDGEVGLYEAGAGLLRPEAAIGAYLRLAASGGAVLRTGVAVLDWRARPSGVSVTTSDGTVEADRLVLAPGAWAPSLVRVNVPLRVERRVQHYWRPSGSAAEYALGRLPIWIWEYAPGRAAYGLPDTGSGVKASLHYVDATMAAQRETVDPDEGAAPARPAEIEAMRDWLRTHLPGLGGGEWLGAKPCLYTLTPDEHFVLGLHPKEPNVSVACGFSGHGFKFAPVVAEILADLALAGATDSPIALFDPARFAERSAAAR